MISKRDAKLAIAEGDNLDAQLRQLQQLDGTALAKDIPTSMLLAQWAEEYAHMSDDERETEDRVWEEIERALLAH